MILNYVDDHYEGIIYVLPEIFAQIPFEIFRAYKRGNVPLYETEEEQ